MLQDLPKFHRSVLGSNRQHILAVYRSTSHCFVHLVLFLTYQQLVSNWPVIYICVYICGSKHIACFFVVAFSWRPSCTNLPHSEEAWWRLWEQPIAAERLAAQLSLQLGERCHNRRESPVGVKTRRPQREIFFYVFCFFLKITSSVD